MVRLGYIGSGPDKLGQIRLGHIKSGMIWSGKVRSGSIRSGKLHLGEVTLHVNKLLFTLPIPFRKQTNFTLSNYILIMAVKLNFCLGFDIFNFQTNTL